nr:hypothetical protein [Candidatus Sigynarchaeota archaeon]
MQHSKRMNFFWAVSSIAMLVCFAFAANQSNAQLRGQTFGQDGTTQLSSQFQQDWFHLRGTTPSTVFNDLVQNGSDLYVAGRISNNALGLGLDMLVARYDTARNLVKNVTWGPTTDSTYQAAFGIAVSGNAIFVAGYSAEKALVVKFDQNLNYVWNSTLGKTSCSGCLADIALNGTSIYVCGYSYMTPTSFDGIVLKYNSSGSLDWNQTWGSVGEDRFSSIVIDGDLVRVFGTTSSYGAGSNDIVMVTYDADGNYKNYSCWGTGMSEWCLDAIKLGGFFYIAGEQYITGKGMDGALVKLDTSGNQVWNRTWGNPDNDKCNCITSNGTHLFVAGVSYIQEDNQAFFIEYDEDGGMHGERTFGVALDYEEVLGILITGNRIFTCGVDQLNTGGDQGFIAMFTSLQSGPSSLQQSWSHPWGGANDEEFDDVVVYNGSIYATGYSDSYGEDGFPDLVVVRYDDHGNLVSNFSWNPAGTLTGIRIAVDAGGIYVAACWDSATGGRRLVNLVKFNANGNHENHTWGKNTFDLLGIKSLVVNGTDVFVSGVYREDGASNFDFDAFVVKFYGNGTQAWNVTTGVGTKYDQFTTVCIDGGIVRILGSIDGYGLDPHLILNNYDAQGSLINSTRLGTPQDLLADAILHGNNFYVAGSSTVEGTETATFVAKFDINGNELWRTGWDKDGYDYPSSIATNGTDLFVAGISGDTAGTYLSSLLDLDMNGTVLGYNLWNASSDDEAYGIACVNDTIYVVGIIYGANDSNAYITKFIPATEPEQPPADTGWIVALIIIAAIAGAILVLYFLDKKKVINLRPFFKKVRDTTGPAFTKMGNGIKAGFSKAGKGKGAATLGAGKVDGATRDTKEAARQKTAANEAARRKTEEESKRKADEEARRKAEEEAAKRKAEAEEKASAKKKADLEAVKAQEKPASPKPAKKAAAKPAPEKPATDEKAPTVKPAGKKKK